MPFIELLVRLPDVSCFFDGVKKKRHAFACLFLFDRYETALCHKRGHRTSK